MSKKLSTTRRKHLEAKIEEAISGINRWHVKTGLWLSEIRDKELYKPEFESWAEYTEQRWGGRIRAFQLIKAADGVQGLSPERAAKVTSERQARALADIPKERRDDAIDLAEESGSITESTLKEAGRELSEAKATPKAACMRICELYALLPKITSSGATAQSSMVKCCKIVREIGCLLEIVMGRSHNWSRQRFKAVKSQLPFGFDRAKECFSIYGMMPENLELEDAAKVADKIFQIMGEIKTAKAMRSEQHAANPAVVIFNVLKTSQIAVSKRLKDWANFDDAAKKSIVATLRDHGEWFSKLPHIHDKNPSADNIIPSPFAQFMEGAG